MHRTGEQKSGGHGVRGKAMPGPKNAGPVSSTAQTAGGAGAKSGALGSGTLKGNRNKGRAKRSRGRPRSNSDVSRSLHRDLVRSMHPQKGSTL